MAIHDLRSYLDALCAAGELVEIHREVSPVHELGAVLRACEQADKAALFQRVAGYDVPVVGGLLNSVRRIALALECPPEAVGERIGAALAAPLPPERYGGPAPCQEVVVRPPLDLMSLPIPTHAPRDAGPFLTGGAVIARDPAGTAHNLSYNRMQVYGPDRTGMNVNEWRHLKGFMDQVTPQGRSLPFCVAIGPDPTVLIAAAQRYDGDEYEIAGALRGAPIPVVPALTCDVLVPAFAEYILECELLPGEQADEGPMAEFTGHYSGRELKPVARVNAITHRRRPIFETMAGASYEHISLGNMLTREPTLAHFVRHISKRVKAVHLPPYGCGFTALISLEKPIPGEAQNVAIAAMASHINVKTVIVLDADIDVYDPGEVMWALSTRVRWDRDLIPIPGAQGNELDPSAGEQGVQCKVIIDATLAADKVGRFVKVTYPPVNLAEYLGPPQ
jgi:2,5-furandicarboxylate decarboxylase 1